LFASRGTDYSAHSLVQTSCLTLPPSYPVSKGDKAAGAKFNVSLPYRVDIKKRYKFPIHHSLANMVLWRMEKFIKFIFNFMQFCFIMAVTI